MEFNSTDGDSMILSFCNIQLVLLTVSFTISKKAMRLYASISSVSDFLTRGSMKE